MAHARQVLLQRGLRKARNNPSFGRFRCSSLTILLLVGGGCRPWIPDPNRELSGESSCGLSQLLTAAPGSAVVAKLYAVFRAVHETYMHPATGVQPGWTLRSDWVIFDAE